MNLLQRGAVDFVSHSFQWTVLVSWPIYCHYLFRPYGSLWLLTFHAIPEIGGPMFLIVEQIEVCTHLIRCFWLHGLDMLGIRILCSWLVHPGPMLRVSQAKHLQLLSYARDHWLHCLYVWLELSLFFVVSYMFLLIGVHLLWIGLPLLVWWLVQ